MFARFDCCIVNLNHVCKVDLHPADDGCCSLCIHFHDGSVEEHHFDTHDAAKEAMDKLAGHCNCCHCC